MRPVVDLPQPLSPTRPRVSPSQMSNDMPSTALMSPTCRWTTIPRVMGKYFFRFSTRTRAFVLHMLCFVRLDLRSCQASAARLGLRSTRSSPWWLPVFQHAASMVQADGHQDSGFSVWQRSVA